MNLQKIFKGGATCFLCKSINYLIFLFVLSCAGFFISAKILIDTEEESAQKTSQINNLEEENGEHKENIRQYEQNIDIVVKKRFKKYRNAHKVFHYYNKNINDTVIEFFLDICQYYKLDTSDLNFNLSLAQLRYESGLRQYRYYRGKKTIIRGYAGEIGMCQIMPPTAFLVLRKMDKYDLEIMVDNFGCTMPDFLGNVSYWSSRKKIVAWLSNIKNNLALWGYLMNSYMSETKSHYKALHIYNAGHGGYNKWRRKTGRSSEKFKYVYKVKLIERKIKKIID